MLETVRFAAERNLDQLGLDVAMSRECVAAMLNERLFSRIGSVVIERASIASELLRDALVEAAPNVALVYRGEVVTK